MKNEIDSQIKSPLFYCLITIQIVTIIVPKIASKLTSQFSTKLYLRSAKGFPDLKSTKLKFACICI